MKFLRPLFTLLPPLGIFFASCIFVSLGMTITEPTIPSNKPVDCLDVIKTDKVTEDGFTRFVCVRNPEEKIDAS